MSPDPRVRIVTATSLFDGHDAAINIMRRIMQASGAEVIHLGHDRSAAEIAEAAIEEDAHAVAVTSYQGGHMEFFRYLRELLDEAGGQEIRIFGGGGGTILPEEGDELNSDGVARIYSPDDGRKFGLQGMIDDLMAGAYHEQPPLDEMVEHVSAGDNRAIARAITIAENDGEDRTALLEAISAMATDGEVPVIGFTGTGGSGKSSILDELVLPQGFSRPQDRRHLGRPDQASLGWRAPGRPHQDELGRRRQCLHAVPRDTPGEPVDVPTRRLRRRDRQGRGLRPRPPRDVRHRPI